MLARGDLWVDGSVPPRVVRPSMEGCCEGRAWHTVTPRRRYDRPCEPRATSLGGIPVASVSLSRRAFRRSACSWNILSRVSVLTEATQRNAAMQGVAAMPLDGAVHRAMPWVAVIQWAALIPWVATNLWVAAPPWVAAMQWLVAAPRRAATPCAEAPPQVTAPSWVAVIQQVAAIPWASPAMPQVAATAWAAAMPSVVAMACVGVVSSDAVSPRPVTIPLRRLHVLRRAWGRVAVSLWAAAILYVAAIPSVPEILWSAGACGVPWAAAIPGMAASPYCAATPSAAAMLQVATIPSGAALPWFSATPVGCVDPIDAIACGNAQGRRDLIGGGRAGVTARARLSTRPCAFERAEVGARGGRVRDGGPVAGGVVRGR